MTRATSCSSSEDAMRRCPMPLCRCACAVDWHIMGYILIPTRLRYSTFKTERDTRVG